MTVLITGGTVVSADRATRADVLVDGETIVALLAPGSSRSAAISPRAPSGSSTPPAST